MRFIVFLALVLIGRAVFAQQVEFDFETSKSGNPVVDVARELVVLRDTCESQKREIAALEGELKALREQIRAMPAKEPTPAAKIVLESLIDGKGIEICEGCRDWWNGPEPDDLRGKNWLVDRVETTGQPGKKYPRWRVCIGDECGFIEFTKDFKTALQKYLDDRASRNDRERKNPFQKLRASEPLQSIIPGRPQARKRWAINEGHVTPSVIGMTIEYHLTEGHGQDITGLSVQQMEALHQRLHGN